MEVAEREGARPTRRRRGPAHITVGKCITRAAEHWGGGGPDRTAKTAWYFGLGLNLLTRGDGQN